MHYLINIFCGSIIFPKGNVLYLIFVLKAEKSSSKSVAFDRQDAMEFFAFKKVSSIASLFLKKHSNFIIIWF